MGALSLVSGTRRTGTRGSGPQRLSIREPHPRTDLIPDNEWHLLQFTHTPNHSGGYGNWFDRLYLDGVLVRVTNGQNYEMFDTGRGVGVYVEGTAMWEIDEAAWYDRWPQGPDGPTFYDRVPIPAPVLEQRWLVGKSMPCAPPTGASDPTVVVHYSFDDSVHAADGWVSRASSTARCRIAESGRVMGDIGQEPLFAIAGVRGFAVERAVLGVRVLVANDVELPTFLAPRTASVWFRSEAGSSGARTVLRYGYQTPLTLELNTDGTTLNGHPIGKSIYDGSWHHLAYAFTPRPNIYENNFGRFYVDGLHVGQTGTSNHETNTGFLPALELVGAPGDAFDELKIYNRTLTTSEIASLARAVDLQLEAVPVGPATVAVRVLDALPEVGCSVLAGVCDALLFQRVSGTTVTQVRACSAPCLVGGHSARFPVPAGRPVDAMYEAFV